MNKIIISKASQLDFDKVYDILMHNKVNPYMNYPHLSKKDFKEIWQSLLPQLRIWKNIDEIYGLAAIEKGTHRIKHIAYIATLAINQNLDQKGLGTVFFEEIISQLKNEGIAKMELCVEVDNKRAISFYEKFGFVVEGVRKNLLNREGEFVDNYYMAKFL